ncbi:MAG: threonylcarbamoyl-AMP synthase [Burkholderiales bacterium]|nr:threonylcarbamoyl-AMP synthase [Phycisphaerae bacterium]
MSNNPHVPLDPILLSRARAMRGDPAPAEHKLWQLLRNRQLNGFKFRRQAPVGTFIADFVCHELKMVVELDGESHGVTERQDSVRTQILERDGYRVVRFWNVDVFENVDAVLETIFREAMRLRDGQPPHPSPLPRGEGTMQGAVELLRMGKLVAFPTETVYGLGADATSDAAVAKIFAAKGRPGTNPLIVHVADESVARRYATHWPESAERLVSAFWPGPLSIVLAKADSISDLVTAGRKTVGLRSPDHALALELLRAFDGPVAAPSANRSNHVSPTTAQHVRDELGDAVDMILDGGPCAVGIESTILDLTADAPTILRPGSITREMIEEVLETPVHQPHGMIAAIDQAATSPGQHAVHYSPRTPAYRFDPQQQAQLDCTDAAILPITLDADTYARQLYARLRLLDAQQLRAIYIELPPDTEEWRAVRDRIMRATKPL